MVDAALVLSVEAEIQNGDAEEILKAGVVGTNRDLHAEIASGNFRQDLYYRLNVIHIHVPPLRDRRDDIAPLLAYFLERYSRQHGVPLRSFSADAVDLLSGYDWPGNVRQLKNAVERLVVKSDGPRIERTDVPPEFGQSMRRVAPERRRLAARGRRMRGVGLHESLGAANGELDR